MSTRATISWASSRSSSSVKRRGLLLLAALAGCGGGGGAPDPGASSVVAARATLSSTGSPAVAIQWAAPLDISAQRLVEYQLLRDGNRIGAVDKNTRSFLDTTTTSTFSYQEARGTSLQPRTGSHSPLSPATAHRYQVRVLFQRIEPNGATTYAESVLNSPGVRTTPLRRPSLVSTTAQTAEALVRFSKLSGATQYQAELSAFADFHTKIVRGPLTISDSEGLVTVPWPTDSVAGGTVYVRVGARNTGDANPPLTTDPNGDDYLYSTPQTVTR